ncbi:NAD(P)-dependent oxidoreductase [Achromobacter arsenitoxydans]|uniref:D-3-phosphoglycerate dehydrogenase n=1 Tax=Achromobacter arsenitoxydans SY8 TaxID=477184 RepID=H0FCD5_9BURK|nr:NAD(P)-dependent oxidoreductase [Achromobacter arsenitoxydans]EHK64104.1 D-3-phosphoglycerate dehydrogenase [Achromobacter arsenitoxydans SY8]
MPAQPVVALTSPIHPDAHARLAAACEVRVAPDASADALRAVVRGAQGLIVRNHLPEDIFDDASSLRAVVRHGVGLDMIPVERATERGIAVANLPGSNTTAVVEYCLGAMLHLRRGLADMDSALRAQGWAPARAMADSGTELRGATCGIVGVGTIGARLAGLAQALGMRTLGLTRRPETLPAGVLAVDKAGLMRESDVIVLCCPLTPQTRGLIDADALALAKPTAILINVARGPVVDAAALADALAREALGGAALDVHDVQPLPADAAIRQAPRVLLTPHVAGSTATSMRRMSAGAVDDMLRMLAGEAPSHPVNTF